jgi:hypothetical protein
VPHRRIGRARRKPSTSMKKSVSGKNLGCWLGVGPRNEWGGRLWWKQKARRRKARSRWLGSGMRWREGPRWQLKSGSESGKQRRRIPSDNEAGVTKELGAAQSRKEGEVGGRGNSRGPKGGRKESCQDNQKATSVTYY